MGYIVLRVEGKMHNDKIMAIQKNIDKLTFIEDLDKLLPEIQGSLSQEDIRKIKEKIKKDIIEILSEQLDSLDIQILEAYMSNK